MRADPSSFLQELPEGPVQYRSVSPRGGGFASRRHATNKKTSQSRAKPGEGAFGDPSRSVAGGDGWAGGSGAAFNWHRGGKRTSQAETEGSLRYDFSDSQEELRLEAGARIVHPRFGDGQILSISGQGRLTRAEIEFADGARRKVMVAHAGLRPA
jgi:hypothetical protein